MNEENFLSEMRNKNPLIEEGDYESAHTFAMQQVPKIKEMTWFGQIGNGVYYADSEMWKWYPNTSTEEVVRQLVSEMI